MDVQSLLSSLVYFSFCESEVYAPFSSLVYVPFMCQIRYLLAQHSDCKDDLFHGIEASISYSLISLLLPLN